MPRLRYLLLALPLLLPALQARAFTPVQHESIIRLGQLNGTALNCGYREEMKRLKVALVDTVPKVTQLGELFEQETHKSFSQMVQKNLPCPPEHAFNAEVNGAIVALKKIWPTAD